MKIDGIIRGWYEKNRRDLPWRHTGDPYKIWLSEIILQQTRVQQGLNYYLDFIKVFPDVNSLALASEDKVLKQWQGLGYYSRARNLHRAAKDVVEQMEGEIPRTYDGLIKLKGVGNYTASAIASICFGEPRAVVDGNVSRVIARLYGVEEPINSTVGIKSIAFLAHELLDKDDPGNHNQAIMEFGALHCVPHSPDCSTCPLFHPCEARRTGRVDQLPVKIPKRKPVEQWMYFYIIICNGETLFSKRGTDGIWSSLYQFPVVESNLPLSEEEMLGTKLDQLIRGADYEREGERVPMSKSEGVPMSKSERVPTGIRSLWPDKLTIGKISDPIRHQLTHRTIHARFIHVETGTWPDPLPAGWIKISLEQVDDFPVPRLINRYMEVVKI